MHSAFVRSTVVFFFALSVLMVAASVCTVVSLVQPYAGPGAAAVRAARVEMLLRDHGEGHDKAMLAVDFDADFAPVFDHWNTRQVYLFLVATHKSGRLGDNRAVLWDKIVETKEEAVLQLKEQRKYYVQCDDNGLRGSDVSLTLEWDVMPLVGRLDPFDGTERRRSSAPITVKMPGEYTHHERARK